MDRRALMAELLEGSVPASPPGRVGPEFAVGWGRPIRGQPAIGPASVTQAQQASAVSQDDLLSRDTPNQQEDTPHSSPLLREGAMFGMPLAEDDVFRPQVQQVVRYQELAQATPNHEASDPRAAFPPSVPGLETEFYHAFRDNQTHSQVTPGVYRGSVSSNQTFVAEGNNCCLFLTGFPADITVREFIHQVQTHQLGKIAAIHINPPSAHHPNAAIKVTMWSRDGAERLRNAIQSQLIAFVGHNLRALWNRNRVGPRPVPVQHESRVILVIGRPEHHFTFKLDRIAVNCLSTQIMLVVYSFGSYINQAQNAYRLIRDSFDPGHVLVTYRRDPCEPQAL
ncbi:hypothetical protein PG985_012766 [Apiospora marii]|uniref:uncharacterized protein n=1 Tax=Apiospora marii TaxID=335849 RepID=UPI003130904E